MTFQLKTYGAFAAVALLAACGGGGDGPKTVFTYQTFGSEVPGTSTIAAAGLTRPSVDEYPDGTAVEVGTLERGTISVLNIAGIIASGAEGPDNVWTDGTTTVAKSDILVGNFDFLVPVTVTGGGGAGTYIVGVVSRVEDLPTTTPGTFIYSGTARVEGILDSGSATPNSFGSDGELTLSAKFEDSLVSLVIAQLNDAGMPFDTVTINDLAISTGANATFASNDGSTFAFANGSTPYTPDFGASFNESASGAFYGGDAIAPSEAGGAFAVVGANGNTIYGIFAADERQ